MQAYDSAFLCLSLSLSLSLSLFLSFSLFSLYLSVTPPYSLSLSLSPDADVKLPYKSPELISVATAPAQLKRSSLGWVSEREERRGEERRGEGGEETHRHSPPAERCQEDRTEGCCGCGSYRQSNLLHLSPAAVRLGAGAIRNKKGRALESVASVCRPGGWPC